MRSIVQNPAAGTPLFTLLILPLALALSVSFNSCYTPPKQVVNASGLAFTKDTFDLGTLPGGQKKAFDIEYRNPSDAWVRILSLSSSCKCVLLENKPLDVAPNSRNHLSLSVETDTLERGEVYRMVALRTSEVKKPVKIAILRFRIV